MLPGLDETKWNVIKADAHYQDDPGVPAGVVDGKLYLPWGYILESVPDSFDMTDGASITIEWAHDWSEDYETENNQNYGGLYLNPAGDWEGNSYFGCYLEQGQVWFGWNNDWANSQPGDDTYQEAEVATYDYAQHKFTRITREGDTIYLDTKGNAEDEWVRHELGIPVPPWIHDFQFYVGLWSSSVVIEEITNANVLGPDNKP